MTVLEGTRAIRIRPWLEPLAQDARYALRAIRCNLAFSALVIITLFALVGSVAGLATAAFVAQLLRTQLTLSTHETRSRTACRSDSSFSESSSRAGFPRDAPPPLARWMHCEWSDTTSRIGEVRIGGRGP